MILQLILILLVANVVCFLFKKISIPSVLGMILIGIVFSFSQVKGLLAVETLDLLPFLAKLGLFVLMFIAGLEVSWSMLVKEKRDSLIVAFFGLVIPFVCGLGLMLILGYDVLTASIVGISMSITAEATKAKVLLELGKMKTRMGSLMIGAGIVDDVFGIVLFSTVVFFFFHLVDGSISEFFNLMMLLFAFFAGVIVHFLLGREKKLIKYFEIVMSTLLVPFFFVEMGMHFEVGTLLDSWGLVFMIVLIAMVGKMAGVFISKIFVKMTMKQAYLVGWGMNSRGAVELALAYSGYKLGILTVELYSAIIIMTFVSTLIFPIVFTRMVKVNKRIMN